MNYEQAVKEYQSNPSKEELNRQAEALCKEMTLKEKIYMLSGHTIGQTQRDLIKTGRNYNVSALRAGGCKRLGVPPVLFTDGPRGVVMGNSTCFPVSMLRASTFDTDIEYRFGKAIADEAIAQGANYFAGVCINLVRNPKWGRTQESYGEDPFLLGEYGAALTRAVQEEGMIACPKHYALNSIEDLRFFVNASCDDRTLYEVYLPHFKKCIDAGADSIMGAYNKFGGEYCCANKRLLTDILRDEWGFDGFVMSDFVNGVHDAESSLKAGLDLEMMFTMHYNSGAIKKLLKNGKLTQEHIDRAVINILRVLIRQTPNIKKRPMSVVGSDNNRALAREIAEKGMVLLENNDILPLKKDEKILVAGPYANEGNVGDAGSSRVWDKNIVTPFMGISKVFSNASLTEGDVAVVCVGSNRKKEGEFFASANERMKKKPKNSGGDRASLRLEPEEIQLIRDYKAQGKKVVVVLYSGCAIIVEEWKDYADAIIMNYYSGCEGGTALANLLCGDKNFSGKLPFTVAKDEADYPRFIGIGEKPYEIEYGYYHGYTKLDKENVEPRYPFGYGLSYTSFEISDTGVSRDEDGYSITAAVKNVGICDGAEVVQVYAASKGACNGDDRPVRLLKGFKRIELKAGEEKNVNITIPDDELKFYSDKGWVMDESYLFYIGNDSRNVQEVLMGNKQEE